MSIVPAGSLSASELRRLGNNVLPAVRDDQACLEALNRSLQVHGEHVSRLYSRHGHVRQRRRRAAA